MAINIPEIPERTLLDLPNEVLFQILGYLSPLELYISVMTVSKHLHQISPRACAGLKSIEAGPRTGWKHIHSLSGWGVESSIGTTDAPLLKTEDTQHLLAQMSLPSMRRMRVNVDGKLKFMEYDKLSASNITVFQLECRSIKQKSLRMILNSLLCLTSLTLQIEASKGHDIFTPLINNNAGTLTFLKARSAWGTFAHTKSLSKFKYLKECQLDWETVLDSSDDRCFQEIFSSTIEQIRVWAKGVRGTNDFYKHDDKADFLEDLRNLNNRSSVVEVDTLKTQLYQWKCPIKRPFKADDTVYRGIDPYFAYYAPVDATIDKNIREPVRRLPHFIPGTAWMG